MEFEMMGYHNLETAITELFMRKMLNKIVIAMTFLVLN